MNRIQVNDFNINSSIIFELIIYFIINYKLIFFIISLFYPFFFISVHFMIISFFKIYGLI